MNKEQFCEICSNFIAPRMVNALAEQAEQKGYFDDQLENQVLPAIENTPEVNLRKMAEAAASHSTPAEKRESAYIKACHQIDELYDTIDDLRVLPDTRKILAHEDYRVFSAVEIARKAIFNRNCDLQRHNECYSSSIFQCGDLYVNNRRRN